MLNCNNDGSGMEALADDDPKRIAYINEYNRQDMIIKRLMSASPNKSIKERLG